MLLSRYIGRGFVAAVLLTSVLLATACTQDSEIVSNAGPSVVGSTEVAEGKIEAFEDDERLSGVAADRAIAAIRCLGSRGWSATVTWDAGIEGKFADDEREAWWSDTQECVEESTVAFPKPDLRTANVNILYAAEVEHANCLSNAGYPLSEIPTLSAYEAALEASRWTAVEQLEIEYADQIDSVNEHMSILQTCWPPSWGE